MVKGSKVLRILHLVRLLNTSGYYWHRLLYNINSFVSIYKMVVKIVIIITKYDRQDKNSFLNLRQLSSLILIFFGQSYKSLTLPVYYMCFEGVDFGSFRRTHYYRCRFSSLTDSPHLTLNTLVLTLALRVLIQFNSLNNLPV